MTLFLVLIAGWVLNVAIMVNTRPSENRSADEKILDPLVYIFCAIPFLLFIVGGACAIMELIDRREK
jgi:ABC-type methionine transport system permease subunit